MDYGRLIELEERLKELPTYRFDYRTVNPACGCVIPIIDELVREMPGRSRYLGKASFLDIEIDELHYICGSEWEEDPDALDWVHMTDDQATGEAGITEAIRRINFVIDRYNNRAEAAQERATEAYYGGSSPQTEGERAEVLERKMREEGLK